MSIESNLCFFSRKFKPTKTTIDELMKAISPTPPIWVTKYPEPMKEWENHFIKRDFDWFPEPEFCRKEINQALIAAHFDAKKFLRVDFASDTITQRLSRAVNDNITSELHNGWIPMRCFFGFGFHDIYEELEHEDGFLFGHATFSCRISAYGFPSNYDAFRAALFALPEVQAVQNEIEVITGPLESCFYSVE